MNESLREFIERVGDVLQKGKIPTDFYDVSSLYQLARGNPAVEKACGMRGTGEPLPGSPPRFTASGEHSLTLELTSEEGPLEAVKVFRSKYGFWPTWVGWFDGEGEERGMEVHGGCEGCGEPILEGEPYRAGADHLEHVRCGEGAE